MVKNLPAMQETQILSLGWEDSPGIGKGNPLQYSCPGNPMVRGAWWAIVYGIVESWTRLLMHINNKTNNLIKKNEQKNLDISPKTHR